MIDLDMLTLEEKRKRVKQLIELVKSLRTSFFVLNDKGEMVISVNPDTLQEMRGILDLALEIGPEDGPTKRKLAETEREYQHYVDRYNKYGSRPIKF